MSHSSTGNFSDSWVWLFSSLSTLAIGLKLRIPFYVPCMLRPAALFSLGSDRIRLRSPRIGPALAHTTGTRSQLLEEVALSDLLHFSLRLGPIDYNVQF